MGGLGAALGYCQALFHQTGTPREHTRKVETLLQSIRAPWSASHELFWGYHGALGASDFVYDAAEPLLRRGRIPVIITGLDTARDVDELASLFQAQSPAFEGESILVRVILRSAASVDAATELVRTLVQTADASGRMPPWWPLLQGDLPPTEWTRLRDSLGDLWPFANIAVNPFTSTEAWQVIAEQTTVAQFVVGAADGVSEHGTISLPPGMRVTGASSQPSYLMSDYVAMLRTLDGIPTIIVLGPSLPSWTDETNVERLQAFMPHLEAACRSLWADLNSGILDEVMGLAA